MTDLAMDYLGLDALLSGAELAWRDTVRDFVATRIRPDIRKWYEQAIFPAELAPEMGRLGLLGTHLSGYGCPGRSAANLFALWSILRGSSGRTSAAIQMDWVKRSVKPSAKPTLVRTQHLPPP